MCQNLSAQYSFLVFVLRVQLHITDSVQHTELINAVGSEIRYVESGAKMALPEMSCFPELAALELIHVSMHFFF